MESASGVTPGVELCLTSGDTSARRPAGRQAPASRAVILEGEALLNDASALLIYRLAIAAVLAGGSIGAEAIAPFLLSPVGSTVAGPAFAWLVGRIV